MPKNAIDISDFLGEKIGEYFNIIKFGFYAMFISLKIDVELVETLSQLMILDTALGVVKVFRLNYKFSFKRLLWGFVTKLLILIIPMVVAKLGKTLGEDFIWAVTFTLKVLIINEGLSCLTNILSAKTKKEIANIDLVTILLYQLRKLLITIASKMFGTSIQNSIDEIAKQNKNEE